MARSHARPEKIVHRPENPAPGRSPRCWRPQPTLPTRWNATAVGQRGLLSSSDGGLRARQGLEGLPFQEWFDQGSYNTLAFLKYTFLARLADLDLSPVFEDFRDWLEDFHKSFRIGIRSKETLRDALRALQRRQNCTPGDEVTPEFDDETLGGSVHYSALINPVRRLKGKLKGLVIRYDPPP